MIVTLTINPAIDKSSTIHKVTPGRKLYYNAPTYEPGGGGINVSRAIKRLLPAEEVISRLRTKSGGLSEEEVTARLQRFGPNVIKSGGR